MENAAIGINWSLLFPVVSTSLFDSNVTTTDLSAYIILFMIAVLLFSIVYVIVRSYQTRGSVTFLLSLLENAIPETLAMNRRDLRNEANERAVEGAIWREFDETLVESHDGKRVFNTVDASYFFNTHSLAQGVTESRLLSALPGILTALGVFGTFVGLQLGISGLQFGGADVLQRSIPQLISGAAVAFSTSVWGVGTSMIFNAFEKTVEQRIRKLIGRLQERIDYLFPRISAEQLLTDIEHHNRESEDTLKGLAEQIGGHMQKAVAELGVGLQTGIRDAIGPGIDKLVAAANELSNRQEAGSEKALETLIGKFGDSIGRLGQEQKDAFEKTSANVQVALSDLTRSLGGLAGELEEKLKGFSSQESQRENNFKDQLARLTENQRETLEGVGKILEGNLTNSRELIDQGALANEQAKNNNLNMKALSDELANVTENLNSASAKLLTFGEELTQSVNLLSGSQLESAKLVERAANENRAVSDSAQGLLAKFEQTSDRIVEVASTMKDSATLANSGFKDLESSYESFISALASRVKEFGETVNKMLSEYSDSVSGQTEHRLNEWNKQTASFSATLIEAVESLHETLNEIDNIVSTIQERERV